MTQDQLAEAIAHHRAGRLAEAEAAYRSVLASQPGHAGVLHNLGVLTAQRGDPAGALALFDRALAVHPAYPDAHNNRAGALQALGRFDDALAAYDRAIALRPDHPEAWNGKGDALMRLLRFDAAALCYEGALAHDPGHYAARFGLGLALNAGGRRAEALERFEETHAIRRRLDRAQSVSRTKMQHDAAQFAWLADAGIEPGRFGALARDYAAVEGRIAWPEEAGRTIPFPEDLRAAVGDSFNRPLHRAAAPELPGSAIDPGLDAAETERTYAANAPGVSWFDGLLAPAALESLERFLLESTIWYDFSHIGGFLAAYLEDGLATPLLLQIGEDLRQGFPAVFRGAPLTQAWAFKCVDGNRGIDVHADAAAVSVNFWVTRDRANREPGRGGLVVYRAPPPADWRVTDYNADIPAIRGFLATRGNEKVVVPYRQNRAVLFNSDLFHESDAVRFEGGYDHHRINVTMLFGYRRP